MAIDTTNPIGYRLHYNNTSPSAFDKTLPTRIGWYDRMAGHSYVQEILCPVDISGIPAGATINAVDVVLSINSRSLPGGPGSALYIAEQDQTSWTDTGTRPIYNDPFNPNLAWNRLRTMGGLTNANTPANNPFDIPSNANMVNLWQNF